jgi:D-xylose transport system substrate-binding protein
LRRNRIISDARPAWTVKYILTTEIIQRSLLGYRRIRRTGFLRADIHGRIHMQKVLIAAVMAAVGFSSAALAEGKKIGVSWAQFQEERWKIDEAAMKAAIEAAGNEYISADAQSSAEKQLSDIDALIAQGVDALIINAWDKDAIGPAIEKAAAEGIPVVGYDRLIEDNRTFYLTFDNVGVGRIIAESVFAVAPKGNYAIIKGDPGDPNVGFLRQGMEEVIGAAVASGDIVIVGEPTRTAGSRRMLRRTWSRS